MISVNAIVSSMSYFKDYKIFEHFHVLAEQNMIHTAVNNYNDIYYYMVK